MNNIKLSDAYRTLYSARNLFEKSTMNELDVLKEIEESDSELDRDEELFLESLEKAKRLIIAQDSTNASYALVHTRLHAMNISSIFLNLADAIEQLAFTDGNE